MVHGITPVTISLTSVGAVFVKISFLDSLLGTMLERFQWTAASSLVVLSQMTASAAERGQRLKERPYFTTLMDGRRYVFGTAL